jgi:ubiquinone/menaquinone biosynthesis C-methylase UbiE
MVYSDSSTFHNCGIFDYLRIDEFLTGMVESRALGTAFELGVIDYLVKTRHTDFEELLTVFKLDRQGLSLIIGLLKANRVIAEALGEIMLGSEFIKILPFLDLLRVKAGFANLVATDFTDLFTKLITDPGGFFSSSRIFDLFSYDKCFDRTPRNYELVKKWMSFTTALTRYEAMVCMKYHDFSSCMRLLDIGGNSGEFTLRICKRFSSVTATVLDLPFVCDIGNEHTASEPEADRITFLRGNALSDRIPDGFDLITFKSMLHDWPDMEAGRLIKKAVDALAPGGTILIFERAPLAFNGGKIPYSMLPILLFFRSFRPPEKYEDILRDCGLTDIKIQKMDLDTPFSLVTAIKMGT